MTSFFAPMARSTHRLPTAIREAICVLKAEHPALNTDEITTICWVRFGHRPSSHTVKRILAENPPAPAGRCGATRPLTMLLRRHPLIRQRRDSQSSGCIARAGRSQKHRRLRPCCQEGTRSRDGPCHPDALGRGRRRRPRRPVARPLGRYGEHGLGTEHAAVWRYGDTLTIVLSRTNRWRAIGCAPNRTRSTCWAVEEPPVYATPFRSPQLALWERDRTGVVEGHPAARRCAATGASGTTEAGIALYVATHARCPDDLSGQKNGCSLYSPRCLTASW